MPTEQANEPFTEPDFNQISGISRKHVAVMETSDADEVWVVPTSTAVPVLLAGSLALAGAGVVFGSAVLALGLICALLCLIVMIRHSG